MPYSQRDNSELINLAELAGVHAAPGVYKILIELLSLQVSPEDIFILLKQICPLSQQKRKTSTSNQKPSSDV